MSNTPVRDFMGSAYHREGIEGPYYKTLPAGTFDGGQLFEVRQFRPNDPTYEVWDLASGSHGPTSMHTVIYPLIGFDGRPRPDLTPDLIENGLGLNYRGDDYPYEHSWNWVEIKLREGRAVGKQALREATLVEAQKTQQLAEFLAAETVYLESAPTTSSNLPYRGLPGDPRNSSWQPSYLGDRMPVPAEDDAAQLLAANEAMTAISVPPAGSALAGLARILRSLTRFRRKHNVPAVQSV